MREQITQIVTIKDHHRCKERIRDFGEVFTSQEYVKSMLDLLSKNKRNFWNNEDIVFFEPTCGHGNFVSEIVRRRLAAFFKKDLGSNKNRILYSIANTINTIWAIDIDRHNIEMCKKRVLSEIMSFIGENLKSEITLFIRKESDFFAHLLCAINWHIHENEALSALSDEHNAPNESDKTRIGREWFLENGHHRLDFRLTWCRHFNLCESENTYPFEYPRGLTFVDKVTSNKRLNGFDEFNFAKEIFSNGMSATTSSEEMIIAFDWGA